MSNNHSSHIPVPRSPRSFGTPNKSSLYSLEKRSNTPNSNGLRPPISVASHLAAFERLDASATSQKRNVNDNQKIQKSTYMTNSRLYSNNNNNNNNNGHESNWKSQQPKHDFKRPVFGRKSENDDSTYVQNKYIRQNSELQAQVREKEEKLEKLRSVSEAVCKEYEQLKRQYEIEMGAMHKAMQQASQWYKQNGQLKRRSQVLLSRVLQSRPDALADDIYIHDEVDTNENEDVEGLRQTITELSSEVARLQTELNSVKLQEFEAQEQAALSNARLEEEKELREKNDQVFEQLDMQKRNLEKVSRLMSDQIQELKEQCEREKENTRLMKLEADEAKKEYNVLSHQNSLLMAEIGQNFDERYFSILKEVENLKRLLEEEKQNHCAEIQELKEKFEEKESNVEFEIIEEKLKLAEVDFNMMQERAEKAENNVQRFEELVRKLEEKIEEKNVLMPPPPPPALPAPPPPPPPPQFSDSVNSSIKLLTREKLEHRNSAISDMQNMLGIPKKPAAIPQQPAIDEIVNQIKGGRFTLKQTDKQREERSRRKREMESAPPAVSEMLNILGTMRRRAKPTRQSFQFEDFYGQPN